METQKNEAVREVKTQLTKPDTPDRVSYSLNIKRGLPEYGSVSAMVSFSSDRMDGESKETALDRISRFVESNLFKKMREFDSLRIRTELEETHREALVPLLDHEIKVGRHAGKMMRQVPWEALEVFVVSMRERAKKSEKPIPDEWTAELKLIAELVKIKREIENKCRSIE